MNRRRCWWRDLAGERKVASTAQSVNPNELRKFIGLGLGDIRSSIGGARSEKIKINVLSSHSHHHKESFKVKSIFAVVVSLATTDARGTSDDIKRGRETSSNLNTREFIQFRVLLCGVVKKIARRGAQKALCLIKFYWIALAPFFFLIFVPIHR